MEAFLTLDDEDLCELGIAQHEPRRQILAAITELKSGKGREKQEYEDSMRKLNSTLKTQGASCKYIPYTTVQRITTCIYIFYCLFQRKVLRIIAGR